MNPEIDVELLLKHIANSDLLGREKLFLMELVQRTGWIPCSEKMPEKSTHVLICAGGNRVTAYYDTVKKVFRLTEDESLYYIEDCVTHWMPLPEPPEMCIK